MFFFCKLRRWMALLSSEGPPLSPHVIDIRFDLSIDVGEMGFVAGFGEKSPRKSHDQVQ